MRFRKSTNLQLGWNLWSGLQRRLDRQERVEVLKRFSTYAIAPALVDIGRANDVGGGMVGELGSQLTPTRDLMIFDGLGAHTNALENVGRFSQRVGLALTVLGGLVEATEVWTGGCQHPVAASVAIVGRTYASFAFGS